MSETPREDPPDWAFLDAVDAMASDAERGLLRPLDEYARRFPAAADDLSSAYSRFAAPGDVAGRRLGPYVLERELGRGGQAVVYAAFDARLGRSVALKVLDAVFRGPEDPRFRRFRREAEAAARIDHPGVAAVYEAGEADGRAYLALRLVPGETLAAKLRRRRESGAGPETPATTARFFAAAARAVHAAHEAGVVHRDLKPANLMVGPGGEPTVLDFGLARRDAPAEEKAGESSALTATGEVLGTPDYMSPEQVEGRKLDRRSDVWSLGASLYEALTLRRPFLADSRVEIVRRVRETTPTDVRKPNPAVSAELAAVVSLALDRSLGRRYATALAFAEDLERAAAGAPVAARPPSAAVKLRRTVARHPATAAALAALLLTLIAGLVFAAAMLREQGRALEEVRRLADVRRARDLLAWADELWPAEPERVPGPRGMDAFLAAAADVLSREAVHRAALTALAAESRPDGTFADAEAAWRHDTLRELAAEHRALAAARDAVRRRREEAAVVDAETLERPRARWESVCAELADTARRPHYGGLRLTKVRGLVPLGFDRASGLAEFAVAATGAVPEREPAAQALRYADDSALVLTLLPGGTTRIGAEAPEPGSPATRPHVYEGARENMGPVREVALAPFFIAKHELTRAQWARLAGADPSRFAAGSVYRGTLITPRSPVVDVSWEDCVSILSRARLALPTEAQWEYAARGGAPSRWSWGDGAGELARHANLKDEGSRPHFDRDWFYVKGVFDGFAVTAPVGSFLPNRFGLYDVHGNAAEWCRDVFVTPQPERIAPDGAPRRPAGEGARVVRGGHWDSTAAALESAARDAKWAGTRDITIGVRPIMALPAP